MTDDGTRDDKAVPEVRGARVGLVWILPLAVLASMWLWFAFSSGGYIPRHWLVPGITTALFALVTSSLVLYPRRPAQLSLLVVGLFACYTVWVAFSALWADSPQRVWLESARMFIYLLIFALAATYLTSSAGRRVFRYLLLACGAFIVAICIYRLWSAHSVSFMFIENRLAYPVSYPNNAAALFLVGFWPFMWLAAGPMERAPVRGVALGISTGLLGLALMTQSRGGLWSLGLSALFMFTTSPARLRTLFYLLVPGLLMVYEFPTLNRYWVEGPEAVGGAAAARTLCTAMLVAGFIGLILALLERWVRVTPRMKVIFGTVVLVAVAASSVYGITSATKEAGGPWHWMSETWKQFTGQIPPEETKHASRFTMVSSTGRVAIWKTAARIIESSPVVGVGADNFVFHYNRLRETEVLKPQQAHSLELQIVGETGAVGGALAFGGALIGLCGVMWPRVASGWRGARAGWLRRSGKKKSPDPGQVQDDPSPPSRWGTEPMAYAWPMALLSGLSYWFIHASVDWLWQMAGVSVPALFLAAAALAETDAQAGVLWPRVSLYLRIRKQRRKKGAEGASEMAPELQPLASDNDRQSTGTPETAKRARRQLLLPRPEEPLARAYRVALVVLALVIMVMAGLPYLSLKYQDSAIALAAVDGARAAKRAERAHWLQPLDATPYLTQGAIYERAARAAAESASAERAGAVLDNLALAAASYERAAAVEPADWVTHFRAGSVLLDLVVARGYLQGTIVIPFAVLYPSEMVLAYDWSLLHAQGLPVLPVGTSADSLATNADRRQKAFFYRERSDTDLCDLAEGFLRRAEQNNPLAPQVRAALKALGNVRLALK